MFAIVTKSKRSSLPLDILFELFDRAVLPVVLYASEIYGHNDSCIKKLEIFQTNTSKLATLVYLHTFGAHIMYYLKITGNWNHIYINYLPAIEYTYLNLDVEATICQSLKYINTQIHMKTAIDCSKSITENFQVCINLLN